MFRYTLLVFFHTNAGCGYMAASRFFTLRSFVRCMVIAFSFRSTLFCIRTANTAFAAFLCFIKINQNASHDHRKNQKDNQIFHYDLLAAYALPALSKAYSVFSFLLVLRIKPMITAANTATAASPARAAPTFKVSGAVIRVPMV